MAAESSVARLDAVPLNRFHLKLLVTSGLGWLFDAMDVILISFLILPIRTDFGLAANDARVPFIAAAGFAGMFLGAAVSGRLADRYGRRTVFQATLVIFSLGSLLSALAPSFELLLAARVVAGLGLGGELPVAATLVSELSPRRSRGRMIVWLQSFWAYGMVLAGLIAVFVLPAWGWRGAFLVGALPALYVAYLRRALPESPRHLASVGRATEADAVVRRVEREGGGALITVSRVQAPPPVEHRETLGDLFSGPLVRRTAMLWLLWVGIVLTCYGIFLYIPGLLGARGLSVVRSNELFFVATIAQIPGYFAAAFLVERWGRKPTLALFLLGTAASASLFGSSGTGTDAFVWVSLLSLFSLGACSIVYAYTTELYPTSIRASGAGAAAAAGLLGGIGVTFVTPLLVGPFAEAGVLWLFTALIVLTAIVVLVLAEETRGRSLEEISAV